MEDKTDVCAIDGEGMTALHYAASYNEVEMLSKMLQHTSANVNVVNRRCHTPLHSAVANKAAGTVALLLKQEHIDVDAKNMWSETPLCLAAAANHINEALLLVKAGASLEHTNQWQETPEIVSNIVELRNSKFWNYDFLIVLQRLLKNIVLKKRSKCCELLVSAKI